jgi:hypothetical protein
MNLSILISPRRELALRSSVPFTPLGKEASIYCYYCPLCMEFFESIMRTKCCGNYICLRCTIEYLNAKGFVAETVREIIGNTHLKNVNCPNCFSTGFNPLLVEKNDSIRDYSREVTGGLNIMFVLTSFLLLFFCCHHHYHINLSPSYRCSGKSRDAFSWQYLHTIESW